MGLTLSYYDAMLKEFYEPSMKDQLNKEIILFDNLQRGSQQFSGRRIVGAARIGRNIGVGPRAEGDSLPTAGYENVQQYYITATYQYGRIELTGQVVRASKNAFAESLAFELEGIKDAIAMDCGRQSYGEGLGILAKMYANVNSQTTNYLSNRFYKPGMPGARYLNVGQDISFGSPGAVSEGKSASIISFIQVANSSVVYDTMYTSNSALTASDTHFVFQHPGGGEGYSMLGLRALIDDVTESNVYGRAQGFYTATIQSLSRATYSQWNANVINNCQVDRIIDGALMQKAFDLVKKGNGKNVSKIIGEYGAVSAFLDVVKDDRRYASNNFDAGKSALSYNGVPLVQDFLAPYNELFLFNDEAINLHVMKDFGFEDIDGSIINKIAGYDKVEAVFSFYGNIGINQPKSTCVIRDIRYAD